MACGMKLSLSLMLQGWMLRYRLLDASRQNSLWLGVAGVFGDPGSLFPARLGVEVFHRWQFCSGDVLLSSFRHSPWCWGRRCRLSWLLLSFSQVSNICSFVNEANLVRFVEVDSGRLPRHSNRQWSCSRHQTLSPNTGVPCASRFFLFAVGPFGLLKKSNLRCATPLMNMRENQFSQGGGYSLFSMLLSHWFSSNSLKACLTGLAEEWKSRAVEILLEWKFMKHPAILRIKLFVAWLAGLLPQTDQPRHWLITQNTMC